VELPGAGRGGAGRRSRSHAGHGRPVGDRPHSGAGELSLLATVRAAAPHQRARGHAGPGLRLERGDLRAPVREGREGNLVLFVVDASGSMAARRRMAVVKGAVLCLLVDAYQRRDRVGLVTFRGDGAELVLPPTSSVELGAARLAELPAGGRTPLAAGIERAREVVSMERAREPDRRALVFLVTDGRANAASGGQRGAQSAALGAAQGLTADGAGLVVVDAEEGRTRLGMATALAASVGAQLVPLDDLRADGIRRLVGARRKETSL
jgi:magnesium chelatase subunit D